MEKNLSLLLKIHFHLPKNDLGRRHVEQEKMGENGKNGFIFGKVVFRTPLRW
jgi:hypothetical protein